MSSVHRIHRMPSAVALACPPVHKRALGVVVGMVVGICIFVLTAFHIALHPFGEGLNLGLIAQYFYGYDVSWVGARRHSICASRLTLQHCGSSTTQTIMHWT